MITRRRFINSSALALSAGPLLSLGARAASPGFKLFETHAHLVSLDLSRYPRTQSDAGGGRRGAADNPQATPTVENLLAWMDANGVEGGAVVQKRTTYGFDNAYILDSADLHKDRLIPVVVLDAEDAKTPATLRELVQKRGVSAVRITGGKSTDGSFPWMASPAALNTWKSASDLGIGIELMYVPPGSDANALKAIAALAKQFPGTRMVVDHLGWPKVEGGPGFGLTPEHLALASLRNIYFKATPLNFDDLVKAKIPIDAWLRRMVDAFGADHIMWGSNIGQSSGIYSDYVPQGIAATAKLTTPEQRQVLRETGKAFFVRGGRKV